MNSYRIEGNLALDGTYMGNVRSSGNLLVIEGGQARGLRTNHEEAHRAGKQLNLSSVCIIASLAIGLLLALVMPAFAEMSAIQSTDFETIRIHKGDTMWGIAQEHGIEGVSTQDVMALIEQHNGLGGRVLQPGQELDVPVRASDAM